MKILVANNRGGVGKSLVSYYALLSLMGAGNKAIGIEIDNSKRLSLLFKSGVITSFPVGPSLSELQQNSEKGLEHWGPILDLFVSDTNAVIDFGANVPKVFFEILRLFNAKRRAAIQDVIVLVPVTSDDAAIEGAALVVENTKLLLPNARLVLCFNTFLGSAEIVDDRFNGVDRIVLPNGRGEVMEQAYQVSNIAPADIVKLDDADIARLIGKSGATAALKQGLFEDWHSKMLEIVGGIVAPSQSRQAPKKVIA